MDDNNVNATIPENDNLKDRELLYDPMFAKKPFNGWEDSEKGGIFGKAITKKIIFVLFLVTAIGCSIFFSFNALGKSKYTYDETENGCQFSEFNGGENDTILDVEFVNNEDGTIDTSKPVTSVRTYAVCCNEYIELIYVGKEVTDLESNCFYYCTNLLAVIVDPENPDYTSVDGVLYSKDMTKIIMHPIKNHEYRAALSLGISAPQNIKECTDFLEKFRKEICIDEEERTDKAIKAIDSVCEEYVIPETITEISDFCFNYCDRLKKIIIPDGVKRIGQMAFFKCLRIESIYIPDGVEYIGPDAFSYIYNDEVENEENNAKTLTYVYIPASVKEIGHHAFYGCLGCKEIYLGASDKDDVKTGEGWLPKVGRKSMKNVEAVYGQERSAD